MMDLFVFSRFCTEYVYMRRRRVFARSKAVLYRCAGTTDHSYRPKDKEGGKWRRPSEVVGKGQPAEFLFGPRFHSSTDQLVLPHNSICVVRFHSRTVQLVLTHNSLCDIGIKYASEFQVKRRHLPHQCRVHLSTRL